MPSLYETTATVGDVASSNFTTLYNASGLTVPNAGAGSVSGNLLVGGNLTVNGTSLLQGAVTLGSTLSLPNYTFPSPDGSQYQVLATDGSGNLYWSNITAIPGADYNISATTATGGANLTLSNTSGSVVDNVKFAGGTNITVSRTDANTITISTTADDIPNGTAAGQVLTWNGSAWTANNVVTSLNAADRFTAEYKNTTTSSTSTGLFRRNFGSTAYSAGNLNTIQFQFDSDSQATASVGTIGFEYDASNPALEVFTSTNNFSTSTNIATINSTNIEFNGTNLYLNKNHTGAPSSNAAIYVERGSSTDASLTWNEAVDQWEFTNNLFAQGNYGQNGDSLQINADSTAVDSYLYMKGTSKYLQFVNTDNAFQFFGGNIKSNYNYLYLDTDNTYPDAGIYLKPTKSLLWNTTASPAPQFEFNDNLYVNGDFRVTGDIYVSGYQVDINSPVKGDLITFDGTKFINDNIIQFDTAAARTRFQFNTSTNPGGINSALTLIKNTGATNYANGDGTGIAIGVLDNTSATPKVFGAVSGAYDSTGNNELRLRSSTDNFSAVDKTLLAVNDNDLAIRGTEFIFNASGTAAAAVDAQITVERGTSGTDSYLKWAEANGRWEFGQSVYSASNIAAAGNVAVNRDASDADAIVVFYKPTTGTETIRWNKTNNRFELTTDMYAPQATIGNIDIDRTTGQIDTNGGVNLTLDSDGGTVLVNDNLNVNSGTLYVDAANNRVGVNTATPAYPLDVVGVINTTSSVQCADVVIDNTATVNTQTTITTSTSATVISQTGRTTQKVVITITDDVTNEIHVLEALAFQKGTTAYLTTYGEMYSNAALATFTANVSGGEIRILATPASTNSTTFKVARISLD